MNVAAAMNPQPRNETQTVVNLAIVALIGMLAGFMVGFVFGRGHRPPAPARPPIHAPGP